MNFHNPPMMDFTNNVIVSLKKMFDYNELSTKASLITDTKRTFKHQEKLLNMLIAECRDASNIDNVYRLSLAIQTQYLILSKIKKANEEYLSYKESLESQYAIFLWLCARLNIKSLCEV